MQHYWKEKFPLICRCWGEGGGAGEARCFLDAAPSKVPPVRSHCSAAVPCGPAKGDNRLRNRLNDSRHLIKCLAERAWRLAASSAHARSPAGLGPRAQVAKGEAHIKGSGFARLRMREGVNYRL